MLVDKMLALTYALQIMESDRKHMLKYMLTSNVSRVFDGKKPVQLQIFLGSEKIAPRVPQQQRTRKYLLIISRARSFKSEQAKISE